MAIIYEIVNTKNGAKYIGSSMRDTIRWKRHKSDLNNGIHHSKYLQRAWIKYGESCFIFNIIKEFVDISQSELLNIEQTYLDDRKLNYPPELNYNISWLAQGGTNSKLITAETRNKMSESHLGIKFSTERKNKLIDGWTNKLNKTHTLISPTGDYVSFKNIRKFCRENDLEPTSINLLLNNKIYVHKGWIKNYSHTYSFISPENIIYENIINLSEFCEKHNLKMKGMSKLYCGQNKTYKGWKKYYKFH